MANSLGDRMKGYEAVSKSYLMRRTPVIVRLDMCHGHTFCKGFKKPFDEIFAAAMRRTTYELCCRIQGCVFGYTQSDEISLLLCDFQKLDTDAWFSNQLEKIVSVSASLATVAFNRAFKTLVNEAELHDHDISRYQKALMAGAIFDSRAFNLAKDEVCNYFIWRQQDATRNAVLGLAQSLYSHNEIQGISCNLLQDKMLTEKDVNFNELPIAQKRGTTVRRTSDLGWIPDLYIPIFTQNREYIESTFNFGED